MPTFDVPYTAYSLPPNAPFPSGRTVMRPVVVMKLWNGEISLSCRAVIDSGADYCAFPNSFARMLGIDIGSTPAEITSGVGSSGIPTHFHNIEMDFNVARVPAFVGFTEGLDAIGLGLLGQSGFFDQFDVAFKLSRGIFQIDVP